jgi:homoserine kinase type II
LAIRTQLSEAQLDQVCKEWNLGKRLSSRGLPQGSINTLYRIETTSGPFVLRLSEGRSLPEIQFETTLLQHLHAARYPAVTLVPRADGRLFDVIQDRYAVVMKWGAGNHVRKRDWSLEQAGDAGKHLGRLHVVTESFDGFLPNRYSPSVVQGWIAGLAEEARHASRDSDPELWDAVPMLVEEADALNRLPTTAEGIIHADYFPDNLLFVGDRTSTVLDFEMACRGPFMLDLATALHACCYGDDYVRPRTLAFVNGYREEREPSRQEWLALHAWARFSALRFTGSRILDFHRSPLGDEHLQKKDWRRFRDRLKRTIALGSDGFLELCGVTLR